jgi:hypothetical protein
MLCDLELAYVRLEVFTSVKVYIVLLWFMIPYSLVGGYQCFGETVAVLMVDEDGGSMFLRNLCTHLSHYKCCTHKTTIEFAFSFANLIIYEDISYMFLFISLILYIFCWFSSNSVSQTWVFIQSLGSQGSDYDDYCLLECGTV